MLKPNEVIQIDGKLATNKDGVLTVNDVPLYKLIAQAVGVDEKKSHNMGNVSIAISGVMPEVAEFTPAEAKEVKPSGVGA